MSKVGELVNFEAGMDIMDLLYEKEETTMLYANPRFLAASVLARSITLNFDLFKCCAKKKTLLAENQMQLALISVLECDFLFVALQVASYVITVPKQKLEFPVLPWGKISYAFSFVMCFNPNQIGA